MSVRNGIATAIPTSAESAAAKIHLRYTDINSACVECFYREPKVMSAMGRKRTLGQPRRMTQGYCTGIRA